MSAGMELEKLTWAFLDGTIGDDDARALRDLLYEPANMKRFVQILDIQTSLCGQPAPTAAGSESMVISDRSSWALRRVWMPLAAAAGIMVIVSVVIGHSALRRGEVRNRVAVVEVGTVSVQGKDGKAIRRPGDWIHLKERRVEAGDTGATLRYRDITMIHLAAGTRLVLEEEEDCFTLDEGGIHVDTHRPVIVNKTRYDQAAVLSTVFSLDRQGEKTILHVMEGKVRFGFGENAVIAGPSEMSMVLPDNRPSAPASPEAVRLASLLREEGEVVMDDDFGGKELSTFWVDVEPKDAVKLENSAAFLTVTGTREAPGTRMRSKTVALRGRPMEAWLCHVVIREDRAIRIEVLDGKGEQLASMDCVRVAVAEKGNDMYADVTVAGGPTTRTYVVRHRPVIRVGPSGDVIVLEEDRHGDLTLAGYGHAGREIQAVSFRVSTFLPDEARVEEKGGDRGQIWATGFRVTRLRESSETAEMRYLTQGRKP